MEHNAYPAFVDQPSRPVPAVTIRFNLAPGVALGPATDVIQHAQDELQLPATIVPSFQGNAQAFHDSLSTVWILIIGALVVVYLILGILYESYIHPITIISTLPSASVGALATLMLFHFDFSLIALIGIILLIGIVKKNGVMRVDFALVAERDDHLSAHDAVRRAALLRFRPIMMTTMAAMLSGVPLMLGTGHRLGTQTTARLRYCGRPPREPGPDAVHDAGHLHLSRSVVALDIKLANADVESAASTASQSKSGPDHRSSRLISVILANCVSCAASRG
jgi:hypothetical protein